MQTKFWHCLTRLAVVAVAVGLAGCAPKKSRPPGEVPTYNVTPQPGTSQAGVGAPAAAYTGEPTEGMWPRTFVSGSVTNLVYQPQTDFWDGHQAVARNAVALYTPDVPRGVYGAVTIHATTLVDKTKRSVTLVDIKVLNGDFPSARDKAKEYVSLVQQAFPKELPGLSLDRLQASFSLAPQKLKGSQEPLNNSPPKMIFSSRPAVLVYVDGPPAYRPVPGTDLLRVINTSALLFKDQSGRHYLKVSDQYLTSPTLDGPWTAAAQTPQGTVEVEKQYRGGATPDQVAPQNLSQTGQASPATNSPPPEVHVATTPTELVMFEGEPNFVPISGTRLLYVANTTGNVFRLLSDQKIYVLLSGRWFRGPSLDGPWEYVPATQLPPDFASIPDASAKENVKASVPGTPQATEALIANSIPQSTKVQRSAQMQDPQIDGTPNLQPIEGTPLFYVANSGTPIIKVDDNSWYACQNGVWFASTSVTGPWTVAAVVPSVIYTIPPSSPLHYLTYVRIYGSGSDYVYAGYTPGYLGTEVEDGVVVYGTGYYYGPWVGGVWYGWPCTWGWGWGPCWNPWYDWSFYWGFGWGCGYGPYGWHYCHPPSPWYGPYRGYNNHEPWAPAGTYAQRSSTAANLYSRSAPRVSSRVSPSTRAESASGYPMAYNSRTGAAVSAPRTAQTSYEPRNARFGSTGATASNPSSRRVDTLRNGPTMPSSAWSGPNSVAPRFAPGAPYSSGGWNRPGAPGGAYMGRNPGAVSRPSPAPPSGGSRGAPPSGGRSTGGGGGGGGHGGGGGPGGGGRR